MKQKAIDYRWKYPMLNKIKKPAFMKTYRTYLYGAYGSNLNESQMQIRCPLAKKIGVVRLPDYELVFRGIADMEHKEGSEIMLGIWQITDKCEHALDIYEGFPRLYGKKIFDVKADNFEAIYSRDFEPSESTKLMIYQMNDQTKVYRPDTNYLHTIANGFLDFAIPKDTIEQALRNSYLNESKDVDWGFE